ncbi:hypothetical protein BGZ94_006931 [Podila epigama]|nr:hypothetical protein BGZ94_006931 [Podila epigama]
MGKMGEGLAPGIREVSKRNVDLAMPEKLRLIKRTLVALVRRMCTVPVSVVDAGVDVLEDVEVGGRMTKGSLRRMENHLSEPDEVYIVDEDESEDVECLGDVEAEAGVEEADMVLVLGVENIKKKAAKVNDDEETWEEAKCNVF